MRKFFKIFLYIIGSILVLLIGVVVWLNTPSGKNFVRAKAEAFLRKKLKTEVYIGGLGYGLPKYVVLEKVLFKDQQKDTLLAVGKLKVDLDMLKLIHKDVDVQELQLEGVHAHVYRNAPDTNFNFSYIITAFTGNKPDTATKKKDTSSSSLKIDLNRVKFDDIHIRFDDQTGGMRLVLNLDHLDLRMKKVDLDNMAFHIKSFLMDGLQTVFAEDTSYLPPKIDTNSSKKGKFQLIADNVDLKRINVQYDDNLNKFLLGLNLKEIKVDLRKFDLASNLVDLKSLTMDTTGIGITLGKATTAPAPVDTIIKKDTTEGWRVNADNIQLAGVNFKMDNQNSPRQLSGIDYSHLDVRGLALNLQNLTYTSDSISGNVKHLAVTEQSGLDLKELRTAFTYNQQGATLNDLYLLTANSLLQNHLEVHYPSLDALKTHMQLMQLKINLTKSIIGLRDVLVFVPSMDKQPLFKKYKEGHLRVEATLGGYLSSLNIPHFYLAGLNNTEVQMNGRLSGLPNANALNYNLNIAKLQSSREDIAALVPAKDLASIRIPDRFGVSGQIAGTMKDYNTNLLFMSTDGGAYVKGDLLMSPGKGRERYNMFVKTEQLNLGHILKQDTLMGKVTASVTAKGTGFDMKTMNATVAAAVQSAYVKGYAYHDLELNGNVAGKKGDIKMSCTDTNLHLQLVANADMSGKYAALKADIQLDSINLQALKLYKTELKARGNMHADFPSLNPDYPVGDFAWDRPTIVANGQKYFLDSLYITSHPSQDTGQHIVAELGVMQAVIMGKTPLSKIGAIIQDHINRHYTLPTTDSTNKAVTANNSSDTSKSLIGKNDTAKAPSDYNLTLQAHVLDRPLLHGLLPSLTSMDSIHIDASLTPHNLAVNVNIPEVVLGGATIENANAQVRGTDSAFTYQVTADQVSESKFTLWFANIHGNMGKNEITTNVSIADSAKKERFALAAELTNKGDTQIVQLEPGLKLNYQNWQVAQPNRIALVKDGFYVSNFKVSNSDQYISINSDEPKANTPIKVDISNFLLANITEIVSKDTVLANGLLGGNVTIQKLQPAPQIAGDLKIQNLSVMGDTLGDLDVQVNSENATAIDTKVNLKGNTNDISLAGTYYMQTTGGNDFNFDLKLDALGLATIEGIAMHQIKNSSGFLRGDLHLSGTTSNPLITGDLHTDQMATNIAMLNAYYRMPSEKIQFNNQGITFDNFSILDSAGHKAILSGTVNTSDLSDVGLDMQVKTKNWRAVHSTETDNKNFYGDLMLTTNLDIKGSVAAPSVDGSINILKGTNFTVVMPESTPQIESSEGIVQFVDMNDTNRYRLLVPHAKKDTMKLAVKPGSNINVNIGIDPSAIFTVYIDQASGDFVSVQGSASLNAAVTPGGVMGLTGTYELNSGVYQLNYNFIKRKFLIQKGSTLTFAGDPTKAAIDITAIYEADVAPYDLIAQQVSDQSQLNYYKENLPFNVELHMKGKVMQPRLTFNVVLPENKVYPLSADQIQLIQGKLNQIRNDTSELNKQVFALLILNRFVSDDPFNNGAGGGGLGFTAMQSVSRFIGEQLNQFAKGLVKGIDLSVDVASSEDYTTGNMQERTDLNLAASKRLLNDRLKLTVGNDFELQGPQTSNNNQSDLIPSNLSADYLLTADGRYTVRTYRRNYDEGVLEGYVTETGVDFIVSLDYNHFKNVFKKRKKESSKGDGKSTKNKSGQ